MTRMISRELVTEACLVSFSGGFLAWYVWAKVITSPWLA